MTRGIFGVLLWLCKRDGRWDCRVVWDRSVSRVGPTAWNPLYYFLLCNGRNSANGVAADFALRGAWQ